MSKLRECEFVKWSHYTLHQVAHLAGKRNNG